MNKFGVNVIIVWCSHVHRLFYLIDTRYAPLFLSLLFHLFAAFLLALLQEHFCYCIALFFFRFQYVLIVRVSSIVFLYPLFVVES